MTTEFSGGGDPARSIALLWGTRKEPSRGPKQGLTVERIVAAAVAVADADGLAALSMRRVAERLGVGTMSLYTYVPAKAELIDVMLDRVLGEVDRPHEVAGGWRERLARIAHDNWALYQRHPWLLQVATARPPLGPNVFAKYEYELGALEGVGLTDLEMDATITLLNGYVHGAARGAVEASQVSRRTGLTDAQWWEVSAPLLAQVVDGDRYPLGGRVGTAAGEAHGAAGDPEGAFAFGLDRILDGLEVLIAGRRSPQGDAPSGLQG